MKTYEEARRELYEQYLADKHRYDEVENAEISQTGIHHDSKSNFDRQAIHREYVRQQKELKKMYGID